MRLRARSIAVLAVVLTSCIVGVGMTILRGDWDRLAKLVLRERPTKDAKTTPAKEEVGRSVQGRPIVARIFGDGETKVLVLGGIHGDEPASPELAKALEQSLTEAGGLRDVTVVLVSEVNPDGLLLRTRQNANGVDLNRNFPASSWLHRARSNRYNPGPEAGSEPETKMIIELIESYRPELVISIHAPLACVNWDGPAETLASKLSQLSGYPVKADIGHETPGSLGSYLGIDRGLMVITLEVNQAETRPQVLRNVDAVMAVLASVRDPRRSQ